MQVTMRRDDAPILAEFRERTGIGTLTARAACGNSSPQASWKVCSGLECLRLAEILEKYPMYGRKRLEVAVWTEAVRATERGDHAAVAQLARQLQDLRTYRDPLDVPPYPATDREGFVWYLGGFFTGEGSFYISYSSARTIVKVRRDDRPLLVGLAGVTGLGKVYDHPASGRSRPSASWVVLAQPQLPEMCELLADGRLRGRKHREFVVWRAGVEEFTRSRLAGRTRDPEVIEAAAEGLRYVRRYVDRPFTPSPDDAELKRGALLNMLREWAATCPSPLASTAYEQARRSNRHWPTRNTIVLEFGPWHAALEAAGVADRASARGRARQRACSASIPTTAARIRRRSSVR
jgi:hypothetical protein